MKAEILGSVCEVIGIDLTMLLRAAVEVAAENWTPSVANRYSNSTRELMRQLIQDESCRRIFPHGSRPLRIPRKSS